jgi:hypothetical protein
MQAVQVCISINYLIRILWNIEQKIRHNLTLTAWIQVGLAIYLFTGLFGYFAGYYRSVAWSYLVR